ncbi:YndM family protein [Bacillus sp. ISL-51]|uniref:YndM family protein n=1 Tax=Bacteria TaxID=2 RepID=UPI001BEA2C72|nr:MULTISPECIES: YndM family protein [Bacteria]MBT2575181.1 YndM family protein [Bacillus sp. ISL-51]MBT2633477.1 YndM family protein [Bacillus sp. ISL-26]MBT2714094.1 YndM family protein [Pseudomonas sp. ISL-88]
MKHLIAFASKTTFTLALLYVILDRMYQVSFLNVLFITLLLSLITYFAGDCMVLPRTNNFTAVIADFGISFIILWIFLMNVSSYGVSPAAASVISALCISVFEAFFHRYLSHYVLPEDYQDTKETESPLLRYQTEASEEIMPENDHQEKT